MASSSTFISVTPSFDARRVSAEPYKDAVERLPPRVLQQGDSPSVRKPESVGRIKHTTLPDRPVLPYISGNAPFTPSAFEVDSERLVLAWDARELRRQSALAEAALEAQRTQEPPTKPFPSSAVRSGTIASDLPATLRPGMRAEQPVSRKPVSSVRLSAPLPPEPIEQPLSPASRSTATSSRQRPLSTNTSHRLSTTTTAKASVKSAAPRSVSPELSTPKQRLRVVNATEGDNLSLSDAAGPSAQPARHTGKAPADPRIRQNLEAARAQTRHERQEPPMVPRHGTPISMSHVTGQRTQPAVPPPSARDEWAFAMLDQSAALDHDERPAWKKLIHQVQKCADKCVQKLKKHIRGKGEAATAMPIPEDVICRSTRRTRERSAELALD
ncbi:hypothetical protein Slin15195_G121660 [Septoria linicola]|uniref:Uncharacterized protein n=1 Tax=Septoria linicola TaxID=215465 RepID=A0A9Q9EQJ0_9PEZI|nr:hypothetical protein Slin14017_G098650 [Septoria linicola]USW58847.1 hypothetical protein Slin15195_G121660 [Septoria linicola]